jgi:hypothetical protein
VLSNTEAHDELVSEAVWQAAQTTPRPRRRNGVHPLSGLLVCGNCGHTLSGWWQRVNGQAYRRYRCGGCHRCTIPADKLEEHLRDKLARMLPLIAEARADVDGLGEVEAQLAEARAERTRFARDRAAEKALGREAWLAGAEARTEAVLEAEARYHALASQVARTERVPIADELDDPDQLRRAASIAFDYVTGTVLPGRGHVSDRVTFAPTLAATWPEHPEERAAYDRYYDEQQRRRKLVAELLAELGS